MKKLFPYLLFSLLFFIVPSAWSFFGVYFARGCKGTVIDALSREPLAEVTISYDIYRGKGEIYRNSYKVFKHVESTTNAQGEYKLPALIKPYWLLNPCLVPANCFIPGIGMHAGFSLTKVTISKYGYRTVTIRPEELRLRPIIMLSPNQGISK